MECPAAKNMALFLLEKLVIFSYVWTNISAKLVSRETESRDGHGSIAVCGGISSLEKGGIFWATVIKKSASNTSSQ